MAWVRWPQTSYRNILWYHKLFLNHTIDLVLYKFDFVITRIRIVISKKKKKKKKQQQQQTNKQTKQNKTKQINKSFHKIEFVISEKLVCDPIKL